MWVSSPENVVFVLCSYLELITRLEKMSGELILEQKVFGTKLLQLNEVVQLVSNTTTEETA